MRAGEKERDRGGEAHSWISGYDLWIDSAERAIDEQKWRRGE